MSNYSDRFTNNITFSLVDFVPIFNNSGSITLDEASITTIKDRREVNIQFSSYDTDLATNIDIPSGLFSMVYAVHCTNNVEDVLAPMMATINGTFDQITVDREDSINTNAPLSITVVGKV